MLFIITSLINDAVFVTCSRAEQSICLKRNMH